MEIVNLVGGVQVPPPTPKCPWRLHRIMLKMFCMNKPKNTES